MPRASGRDAALRRRLAALHVRTLDAFADQRDSPRLRRGLALPVPLFGLELMCKLEEQVLLPALAAQGDAATADSLRRTREEIGLLRDLSALAVSARRAQRSLIYGVIVGMASIHFARFDELLAGASSQGLDWPSLEAEVDALMARWRTEVSDRGDIEDEERDPVGQRPR